MPYDEQFIQGHTIPFPSLAPSIQTAAFDNGSPIEHPRFSIVFNRDRGFAIATAHNIDGGTVIAEGVIQRNDAFRFDTQVPNDIQVDNDRGYRGVPNAAANPWDRGHLVRRRSMHWGDETQARAADRDSFFWTNIVPQHENLHDTAWGNIEDFMLDIAIDAEKRACVFQGPILTPDDPVRTNMPGELPIQIPAGFWKVFCILHQNRLRAACFLIWQRDYDQLEMSFNPVLEQVRITTIEYLSGLIFAENIRRADALLFSTAAQPLTADAQAAGAGAPRRRRLPGNAILKPADIVL
ncbi:MAG TPA: DNA/RNA non-specific endonuclease [Woeseiaceae bacterium]|nr:DNA/RNA non-specific endonuclease [Woeseiaceae bacterium]